MDPNDSVESAFDFYELIAGAESVEAASQASSIQSDHSDEASHNDSDQLSDGDTDMTHRRSTGGKKSYEDSVLDVIKTSMSTRTSTIAIPVTTRVCGFIAQECMKAARESPERELPDIDQWAVIRACYLAFTTQVQFVHEKSHFPSGFVRLPAALKNVLNEVRTRKTFTFMSQIVALLGEVTVDGNTYVPIIEPSWGCEITYSPPRVGRAARVELTVVPPRAHELTALNWNQCADIMADNSVANRGWRQRFSLDSPFNIPHDADFVITPETHAAMIGAEATPETQALADVRALDTFLDAARCNLASHVTLDQQGSVAQLIQTKNEQISFGVSGVTECYSVSLSYGGAVSQLPDFRMGQLALLGEYPTEDQPYAAFNHCYKTQFSFIDWRKHFARMAGNNG